ncbi:MAG: GNAT family acetyltransferase [Phycisphaerae bacterium SG8_4]|nr:MAG: GNAT family acetyltransferase [Phycisphaerae bacterium SG8_4]
MNIERVSTEAQIETVAALAHEIWNQHFIPIIGKAQVDYMLEKFQSKKAISEQIENGYSYYLLKAGDEYVGYTGVCPKEDGLFLSKLYIRASQRGKGLGREAIEFLGELAGRKGLSKITLTVNKNNTDSIKAYEKLGFANLGVFVQDIGSGFVMDDYKMEKVVRRKELC